MRSARALLNRYGSKKCSYLGGCKRQAKKEEGNGQLSSSVSSGGGEGEQLFHSLSSIVMRKRSQPPIFFNLGGQNPRTSLSDHFSLE